jgi:hypothetical protein
MWFAGSSNSRKKEKGILRTDLSDYLLEKEKGRGESEESTRATKKGSGS